MTKEVVNAGVRLAKCFTKNAPGKNGAVMYERIAGAGAQGLCTKFHPFF
jgi:hypothetical protein